MDSPSVTLIGILPAHGPTGAFFTATSMIGMIALAGIIVRNSILLVDFIELGMERGRSLRDAVLASGLVRARPIVFTAAAVVIGGAVMVTDAIFQGLGVAMISGAIVSTALTLIAVPLLHFEMRRASIHTREMYAHDIDALRDPAYRRVAHSGLTGARMVREPVLASPHRPRRLQSVPVEPHALMSDGDDPGEDGIGAPEGRAVRQPRSDGCVPLP